LASLAAAALLAPAVTVEFSRAASGAQASVFLVAGGASAVLSLLVIGRMAGLLGALQRSMAQVADLQRERGEGRFRSRVQNSIDVVALLDVGGIVTYVSSSIERVSGHDSTEVIGMSILDFIHPEDPMAREAISPKTPLPED
jgi:PAS domain-containing protein